MLKSIHFADDTTLYLDINPSTDYTSLIKSELARVQTWIRTNKLSLNIQKTNYMIISSRKHIENINISLSGQPIAQSSHHKLLGIFIDDKLKFDKHLSQICSKMSQSVGVMRHISHLFYEICIIYLFIQDLPTQSLHGVQHSILLFAV